MSKAPSLSSKPSARDYADAIKNLRRLEGFTDAECREAFDYCQWDFLRTRKRLQAKRKAIQDAQTERDFQQILLEMNYDATIRTRLQSWCGVDRFDPLRNPADAYGLMETLADKDVAVDTSKEGECYRVRMQKSVKQSWFTGEGVGDSLREALVLAWYQAFGEVTP